MSRFKHLSHIEDMGITAVENAFINHYMPAARGDYVKVYLYGLKCCYALGASPNDSQIAEALKITEEDVAKAWEYWAGVGVIYLDEQSKGRDVEYLSLSEALFAGGSLTPRKTAKKRASRKYTEMFGEIESRIARPISPNEQDIILSWIEDYSLTPQTVVLMIEDCLNRDKRTINYWDAMALVYYDNGISTYDQLSEYIAKRDAGNKRNKEVLNYLGIYTLPSDPMRKIMDKWFEEYKMDMETIKKACDETVKITKPNLSYVDKILTAWHNGENTPAATPSKKTREKIKDRQNYDVEAVEKALFGDE